MQDDHLIGEYIDQGVGLAIAVNELDQHGFVPLGAEVFDNRSHFAAGQAVLREVDQQGDSGQQRWTFHIQRFLLTTRVPGRRPQSKSIT